MLYNLMAELDKRLGFQEASAHCDVPCGIYDPIVAQIDALTVVRMMDLIAAVETNFPEAGAARNNALTPLFPGQGRARREAQEGSPRHLGRLLQGPARREVPAASRPGAQDHDAGLQGSPDRPIARPRLTWLRLSTSSPRSSGKQRTCRPSAPRPLIYRVWS